MNNKYHRSKNKWNSQRISKRFKNRHLNDEDRNKYIAPKENANLYIRNYKNESTEPIDSIEDIWYNNHSNNIISSWICKQCTYHNVERNSYCTICELPFNSNNDINNNTTTHMMGDYLQPILSQIELKQDDFDEQIQCAIALSLQNITSDSDDTDDTVLINTTNTAKNNNNIPIINNKKRKSKPRGISFAVYWQEMCDYNTLFQKNLKYIIKQNKLRMKHDEDGHSLLWEGHGNINAAAFDIIKQNEELMRCVPSKNKIYDWLGTHWNVRDFSIKNIINSSVLQRFIARGKIKRGHLQIVYHGTRSSNDQSIINNGLVVGGTKGVSVANGRAYGSGVYCSPSLSTASGYERGSLFICLVRSHRCTKSGTIYVVPNDSDILPVYLSSFSYSGVSIANNTIFKFKPGWKPLNLNVKANKERKVKRKWAAYHKLKK